MPCGIKRIVDERIIVFYNPSALNFLGLSSAEFDRIWSILFIIKETAIVPLSQIIELMKAARINEQFSILQRN